MVDFDFFADRIFLAEEIINHRLAQEADACLQRVFRIGIKAAVVRVGVSHVFIGRQGARDGCIGIFIAIDDENATLLLPENSVPNGSKLK